jgi:hypothetical protein
MRHALNLFIGMFSTLLAIIKPLEALPVYLRLLEGKSEEVHQSVARRSCIYALLMILPDLRDPDPASVRGAAGHGPNCRRHHPGEDRF